MSAPAGKPGGLRHGARGRRLLTVLFLVHWGAVAVFLLPMDAASLAGVPALVAAPLAAAAPLARGLWPLARPWLDATSTRQHWTLFAPDPADWSATVEAVAWYGVHGPGERSLWVADTLLLTGGTTDPFPHWTGHRPYRLAFNLGYEGWGDFYRPLVARRLCRELGTPERRPAGISLAVAWEPLDPPWSEARTPTRQWLGGFGCDDR